MATIKWETAKHMMNIVAFTCVRAAQDQDKEPDIEGIEEFTRKMFRQYCEVEDITAVEEEEEKTEEENDDENKYCDSAADCFFCNSDDEEQNEDEDDNEEDEEEKYAITLKGQLVLGLMQTGMSLEEANARVDMFLQLLENENEEEEMKEDDEDEEVEVEIEMDVNVDENGNFECSITKGDLVLALMQAGYSFDQACAAVGIFGKGDE